MNGVNILPNAMTPKCAIAPVVGWAIIPGEARRPAEWRECRFNMASTGHERRRGKAINVMNNLLAAVAESQDRKAFKALFEFFAPRIKGFMYRRGVSPDMVEEVVQDTMVNVWRKAKQFDPAKASASTWVFTIARNARIDLLRKQNRPIPDINDPSFVSDPEPNAHQIVSNTQDTNRLKTAIAGLPVEQQEVLRLAFYEDKAHAAVAQELGIPLGTVKSRIRLAIRRIRSELGDGE
jgi:RNA polymerase sigma-70 factor (ECF subfamily)